MFVFLFTYLIKCETYAVLIAGSRTWMNYRHQADISAIYQLLIGNGIKKENIKQFQYDDIINNEENQFKGSIFHDLDHVNVYPGNDAIDFKGNDVTSEKLYDLLSSLKTKKDDNLLIYYDNHGGPGTLYVPNSPKDTPIYGDELNDVLQKMHDEGKYGNILFIIEACESGSLINFMKTPNILVLTAAGPAEESRSAVYDPGVDNILSNEFTYNLINILKEKPSAEIGDVFASLLKSMKGSTPMIGGDDAIAKMKISDFFGLPTSNDLIKTQRKTKRKLDLIPQRNVHYHLLKKMYEKSYPIKRSTLKTAMMNIQSETQKLVNAINKLASSLDLDTTNFPIKYNNIPTYYFDVLRHFISKYGEVQPDDMGYLANLVHICNYKSKDDIINVINTIFD